MAIGLALKQLQSLAVVETLPRIVQSRPQKVPLRFLEGSAMEKCT